LALLLLPLRLLLLQALLYEPGTHVVASGALAVSSGAQTGRCPAAKHVVREAGWEDKVWWGGASPNHAMEER
jgi:ATP-dependent phosphoenolpyruvate carboxykinase